MDPTLILSSFFAGVLTVLAPCILPLLPVIIGSTATSKNRLKPIIITFSLGMSIVVFTLLLKVSTIFIDIPQSFWDLFSGAIVLLYGLLLLFPDLWTNISTKLGFERSSQESLQKASTSNSNWSAILVGFSLGPVFSSCSPTYFLIIATVLPVSFMTGLLYLLIYAFGLMLVLGLIAHFGQRAISKLKWAANPKGNFKKFIAIILVVIGLLIMTGYVKVIETNILNSGFNPSEIEDNVLGKMTTTKEIEKTITEKYIDYSSEKVEVAKTKGYNYALFFHADWCPTCKSLENDILNNKDDLPENGIIFKVNFDKEFSLKKEYSVLTQTTVLFFDSNGNLIDRKINPSLDRIYDSLSKNSTEDIDSNVDPIIQEEINSIQSNKDLFLNSKEYFDFLNSNDNLSKATFAGGCFWCMEGPFESEYGVVEVFAGYAGGSVENPSYKEVITGETGAREAVTVFYDNRAINYNKLLEIFWRQIDPTDDGGQFADRGSQYTTAIFYHDEDQDDIAQKSKNILEESGEFSNIATKIEPFESFYLAEEYHQDYYKKSESHYKKYKKGSGRESNIEDNKKIYDDIFIEYEKPSQEEIKNMLDKDEYAITQEGATEKPFDNEFWDHKEPGIYVDVVTGEPLFSSTDKFDSGTGWPSFTRPIDDNFITEHEDNKLAETRTEVKSKVGDSHLGHVFNDGPVEEGGMRYCINSAALDFVPLEEMEEKGYGKYLDLFS